MEEHSAALLPDKTDPSGSGMFSHLGRLTNYQHTIFQRRGEILQNKMKRYRPPLIPFGEVSFIHVDSRSKSRGHC